MFEINEQALMKDTDYTHRILTEQQDQHLKFQKYTVRLECKNCGEVTNIELLKPEDTYVECPRCFKHYLMTYSANRTKLWS